MAPTHHLSRRRTAGCNFLAVPRYVVVAIVATIATLPFADALLTANRPWGLPRSTLSYNDRWRQRRLIPSQVFKPAWMVSADQEEDVAADQPPIESMRVKELQAELKQRNVAYVDCFDKESLVARLKQARETTAMGSRDNDVKKEEDLTKKPKSAVSNNPQAGSSQATAKKTAPKVNKNNFDRESNLHELRSMRVRELREECARRHIRWANFVEKEDLVQALLTARATAADFSVSGAMAPGQVTDLTGDQLEQELSQPSHAPLLLDVYATWCGPCQMMAPQLEAAAAELGDRCRVGKLDSDKYPAWAGKLKAGALPTVLVLNGSAELQRIEGALMKDQILRFVDPHL